MSIHTQQHQALAGLVLVSPQIDIWGGSVTFDARSQLSETARKELPPHELATNGRLHLIPTGAHRLGGAASPLATLTSLRKAVARRIRFIGFPFLGGVAIPQTSADEVLTDLLKIEQQFSQAVGELLDQLPDLFVTRQEEFPQWASVLLQHQPEPQSLRSKFRFRVHMHGIAVPNSKDAAAHCHTTASEALPALLAEIAECAEEQLAKSFTNRSAEVTQKAISPVRHLIAKLDAFSFVDPQVGPLVAVLNDHMRSIPRIGPLSPDQVKHVVAGLALMANPQHLLAFGAQHASSSMQASQAPQPSPTPHVPPVQPALVLSQASAVQPVVVPSMPTPRPPHTALPTRFSVGL